MTAVKYEEFLTPAQISFKAGKGITPTIIRDWCNRPTDPLPHITTGNQRKLLHIRWSEFEKWIAKEQFR